MIGYRGTPGPCPSSIPWEVIAPYEGQALINHQQSLEKLASRGGLDPGETYLVMTGRCWKGETFTPEFYKEACAFLDKLVRDRGELQTEITKLREESANWQESVKNLTAAASDLRTDLDTTKLKLAEAEKLKQGYYDEAAEGWKKFRNAELQIDGMKKVIEAARAMSEHMKDRHELSSCCHDFAPTPAYLLEQALKALDAGQQEGS